MTDFASDPEPGPRIETVPVPSTEISGTAEVKRRELDALSEEVQDDAIILRGSVVRISAKFGYGTPEADLERKKLERLIRMLTQQHLKSLSQCVKLLVMGLMRDSVDRAMEGIKAHLGALLAGQVALAEERGRLFRREERPVLIEVPAPPELLVPPGARPVPEVAAPPLVFEREEGREVSGHTEAPKDGTQS